MVLTGYAAVDTMEIGLGKGVERGVELGDGGVVGLREMVEKLQLDVFGKAVEHG